MGELIVVGLTSILFVGWVVWGVVLYKDEITGAVKKLKPKKKEKAIAGPKKSDAFVKGYSDMGVFAADVPRYRYIKIQNPEYKYITDIIDKQLDSIILDSKNNPSFEESAMRKVAIEVLNGGRVINPKNGQVNIDYLGGTPEEFNDYYLGGMKFLYDVDTYKGIIQDEKIVEKNKKALVQARMKGLEEVNEKIMVDMKSLDAIREGAFNRPVNAHEVWDKQMKELS